jgi:hypothetical protein
MAEWWWKALYVETCNCAPFGCGCNYTALPTHETCDGICVFEITEGAFGETRLDGLRLGMVVAWPGPIHEGKGRGLIFVDERANEAQRAALAKIGRGEAGPGGGFAIYASTYDEPAAVAYGPIEFEREGKRARFRLGEVAEAEVEPFRSVLDGAEADVRWVLPSGFEWQDGEIVRTKRGEATAEGLRYQYEDSWGVIAEVAYNV